MFYKILSGTTEFYRISILIFSSFLWEGLSGGRTLDPTVLGIKPRWSAYKASTLLTVFLLRPFLLFQSYSHSIFIEVASIYIATCKATACPLPKTLYQVIHLSVKIFFWNLILFDSLFYVFCNRHIIKANFQDM